MSLHPTEHIQHKTNLQAFEKWKSQQFYSKIYSVCHVVVINVALCQQELVRLCSDQYKMRSVLRHTKFELSRHETSTERS